MVYVNYDHEHAFILLMFSGNLESLTTLKADNNQLTSLPSTIGGYVYYKYISVCVNMSKVIHLFALHLITR